MVLCCLFCCQSFGDIDLSFVCSYYSKYGLGCSVATFWERAAHSVDHMFSLYFDYFDYLLLCGFCFERFPLPLGAWDGLRYFIVALPEPSI